MPDLSVEIEDLHRVACDAGLLTYKDPGTGYSVFTKLNHLKRGFCCGNGCRHCPFGHLNVRDEARRTNRIQEPVLLRLSEETNGEGAVVKSTKAPATPPVSPLVRQDAVVVSFSGGKDSYLAIQRTRKRLQEEGSRARVVLLTTFHALTGVVPQQQLPFLEVVVPQARALRLDLMAVPLDLGGGFTAAANALGRYEGHLLNALQLLGDRYLLTVRSLVFGDLHVVDIRRWREAHLRFPPPLDDLPLEFPLWEAPYSDLEAELAESGAEIYVSAVCESCPAAARDVVRVGAPYDAAFRTALRQHHPTVDAFGELGEFHTVVVVPGMSPRATLRAVAGVANTRDPWGLPTDGGPPDPTSPAR